MPIIYEIHITVSTNNHSIDYFRKVCGDLNVKPIVLDLQDRDGNSVMEDVMTSSHYEGTDESTMDQVDYLVDQLSKFGFEVKRRKIEVSPNHPKVPKSEHDIMPDGCYFESHVGVKVPNGMMQSLHQIAKKHGAHLSKNAFKNISDSEVLMMVTYRSYNGYLEKFQNEVNDLRNELTKYFEIDRLIVEFAISDTKINHDNLWINA